MISYKCSSCHAVLESPTSMAGQQDECPICKTRNVVPAKASRAGLWVGVGILGAIVLMAGTSAFVWHLAKQAPENGNHEPSGLPSDQVASSDSPGDSTVSPSNVSPVLPNSEMKPGTKPGTKPNSLSAGNLRAIQNPVINAVSLKKVQFDLSRATRIGADSPGPAGKAASIQDDALGPYPLDKILVQNEYFSKDRLHEAYSMDKSIELIPGNRQGATVIVVDGKQVGRDGTYVGVPVFRFAFSPTGEHYAFDTGFVTVDGVENRNLRSGDSGCLQFSADGKHVAYLGQDPAGVHAVIDGTVGPPFAGGAQLTLSPDGKRVAFWAGGRDPLSVIAVIDAKSSVPYGTGSDDARSEILFSPDSKHVAYAVETLDSNNRVVSFVVLDGDRMNPGPRYDGFKSLTFSPDSKHLAYIAEDNQGVHLVLDDQPGPACKEINPPILFSPDSRRVACQSIPSVSFTFPDGTRLDGLYANAITFSAESRLAYLEQVISSTSGASTSRRGSSGEGDSRVISTVVIDGNLPTKIDCETGRPPPPIRPNETRTPFITYVSPKSGLASPLVFSSNGKSMAFVARDASTNGQVVFLDGQRGTACDQVSFPVFSHDGTHLAFVATKNGRMYAVEDGQPFGPFDTATDLAWSATDARLVFAATKGTDAFVVVEGQSGHNYERVFTPVFHPDGSLEYLAAKGGQLYRVKQGTQ